MKRMKYLYKRSIWGLYFFLGSSSIVIAFEATKNSPMSGEIRGKIIDSSTGKPLYGVNVFIEHTMIGSATDVDGEFFIPAAPVGKHRIVVSMIGYSLEHREISIIPNQATTINFELMPSVLEMGAVVITGTATPRLYQDSPVRTTIIPRKKIEENQSCNLAEALSFATGVRVENDCQNCNFTQVRILGLDGKYSQILVDGDPVISSLAGVYGLEQIPEEMIDQIEIVKGGGSSLYGGGAIAGVVNLRTRRPSKNQFHLKYLGNALGDKMDHHVGATAEFVNANGYSGGFVFASTRERNPYDRNHDGYSELGQLKNESLGFNYFSRPMEMGEINIHIHRIHETRRGGNKFDLPYHEAQISEALESWRWGGTVKWQHFPGPLFDYRLYYSFALQERNSYYGGLGTETPTAADSSYALTAYGKTKNPLQVCGVQINHRLGNQLLTGGIQYSTEHIDDRATANPTYYIDETYHSVGLFIQDHFHFFQEERVELIAGVRADKHSEIDHWIFSPRMNGNLKITEGLNLRESFTTGFKPPQTYDEDLHLCGIAGDQRITRNHPDLKPEKSYSFSGGFEFQNRVATVPLMFGVTGFYTRLFDTFTEEHVATTEEAEIWERINYGGANVKGIEFDMGLRPVSSMELRGGLTYKKSRYDEALEEWGTKNFLRTPDIYGYLWASFDLSSNITFYTSCSFTGSADVPHEGKGVLKRSDNYTEFDLGVTVRLSMGSGINGKLNIGVKNITDAYQKDLDAGVNRDPAYVYGPMRPRTVFVGYETLF